MPVFADLDTELFPAWVPGGAGASAIMFNPVTAGVIIDDTLVWDLWAGAASPLAADNLLITATYDDTLARVRLVGTGLEPFTLVRIERSIDQIVWTTVRGGVSMQVVAGVVALDDYEFVDGVINYYRMVTLAPFGQTSPVGMITPVIGRIWIKSVTRPFLNRPITVVGWSTIERPARSSSNDVIGRSLPIAVTDVRGSRRWTLRIYTATAADAQTMDYILASGDVLFLHVPADCPVPGGYLEVRDTGQSRVRPRGTSQVFELPVIESAAPAPDINAATSTWQTVLNSYATWADVLAANPTWADLIARIAPPNEVIVP